MSAINLVMSASIIACAAAMVGRSAESFDIAAYTAAFALIVDLIATLSAVTALKPVNFTCFVGMVYVGYSSSKSIPQDVVDLTEPDFKRTDERFIYD